MTDGLKMAAAGKFVKVPGEATLKNLLILKEPSNGFTFMYLNIPRKLLDFTILNYLLKGTFCPFKCWLGIIHLYLNGQTMNSLSAQSMRLTCITFYMYIMPS